MLIRANFMFLLSFKLIFLSQDVSICFLRFVVCFRLVSKKPFNVYSLVECTHQIVIKKLHNKYILC